MTNARSVILVFVGAIAGLASAASAQQRVNQQGDALDANNRVGESRSYGTQRNPINDRFRLGNALITRDVTAGRAFRDFVPYGSDRSFRDFTAGRISSNFAGNSSGVTPSGIVINNAQIVRPYYGSSQIVQPPSDYARIPGTGGYVPPTAMRALDSRVDPAGRPNYAGRATAFDAELNLRLSSDASERFRGGYADSYLRSAGNIPPILAPGGARTDAGLMLSPYTQLARDARLEPLTPQRLSDLRSELLRDLDGRPIAPEALEQLGAGRAAEGAQSTNEASSLEARSLESQAEGAAPLDAQIETSRQRLDEMLQNPGLRLADPAEQSTQYAQLQERLRRFRESGALESLRPLGTSRREGPTPAPGEESEGEKAPAPAPTAPGQPAQPPARDTSRVPGLPDFLPPLPQRSYPLPAAPGDAASVEIRSLADGVTSPSLRRMYQQAEELMDEERYVSAIARYDAAERLVPNQPLTFLGRATAELGAGYYRRCSTSLQRAFTQSPELMMARLDLPGLIGQRRLDEVQQTLERRLADEQRDPDPAFLLGFIAFHSGDRAQAARMLALAEQRSADPFYAQLAAHWNLPRDVPPATQPTPEAPQP